MFQRAGIDALVTSTLLTLFVVLIVYRLLDNFTNRLFRRARSHRGRLSSGRAERDRPDVRRSGAAPRRGPRRFSRKIFPEQTSRKAD
jgi:hypothetical protein